MGASAVNDIARRGTRANRLILAGLVALTVIITGIGLLKLAIVYPPLVDLEIPLRAAERWLNGGSPYLASSFAQPAGYSLPFLYAPPTLPFFAALSMLPRPVAYALWIVACLTAAAFGARRLGVPWLAMPIVFVWPPFAEAILGGNVQVLLFAAFVAAFFGPAAGIWQPRERDVATAARPGRIGMLAAFIPTMKISLPHAWVAVARRRPVAAAIGAATVLGAVIVTLPLVGIPIWGDWIAQLGRAMDPTWSNGGYRMAPGLPSFVPLAVWVAAVLACLIAPAGRLGTWVGILSVIGAATLHAFSLLFVVPALLAVRRELGLLAAFLIASGCLLASEAAWLLWAGALLAALGIALESRWPSLTEAGVRASKATG
jgi:hypothetical protein